MKYPIATLALICGLLITGGLESRSQPLTVYSLAGSTNSGSVGGYRGTARFNHPLGVAADSEGNFYVADTENATIRKITPDGFVSTLAGLAGKFGSGSGTGTNSRFYGPQGLAVDAAGNIIVADAANALLRKVTPGGTVSTLAGLPGSYNSFDGFGANARFYQPAGVALDQAGNIYVADAWNHTIRKLTPAGLVSTVAGSAGNSGSLDGTSTKARFNRPAAVAVDAATNLFVTDSLNHTIRKITPAGLVSTIAGLPGVWGSADGTNSAARFYLPQGIVAIGGNTLFVSDSGNHTIRQLTADGTNWIVSTVAGLEGQIGSSNGEGASAQFQFPSGLALDRDGYLYLADSGNNLVRTTRVLLPRLYPHQSANQFVLLWPAWAEDFSLESSPALGDTPVWTTVTNGIVNLGDHFGLTNSLDGPSAFYRLHQP